MSRFLSIALLAGLSACSATTLDSPSGSDPTPDDPGTPPTPVHEMPPHGQPPTPDDPPPDPQDPPDEDPPLPPAEPDAVALLEIHAMDLWGQYLEDGAELEVYVDGKLVEAEPPLARISLTDSSLVTARLKAPEHEPLEVSVGFTGDGELDAVVLDDDGGAEGHAGVALAHDKENAIAGRPALPVHRLYLGLRHKWFSASGRPPRHGNYFRLFMDGEEAWTHVAPVLRAAQNSILLATWFFESDFELIRDPKTHVGMSQADRQKNTMLAILDGAAAYKRVLVGQFWRQDGTLSDLSSDAAVRAKGAATGDRFEYMGQANETFGKLTVAVEPFDFEARVRAEQPDEARRTFDPMTEIRSTVPSYNVDLTKGPISADIQLSSNHQKFIVVDDDHAFVGGMNVKLSDWDTSKHLVYDPRRMDFESDNAARLDVQNKKEFSDTGPRKDYMVELMGPAAQDVADVFKKRWDLAKYDGVEYSRNASSFDTLRDGLRYGDTQVQVTATLPDPIAEQAIMESWLNAVAQAETYIYIEDQYFRAPILNAAIVARMRAKPKLKLVVITKPVSEWTDPGCVWTLRSYHAFADEFGSARAKFLQLRSFDTVVTWGIDETEARFLDMDVHSKMLIVDDKFMSVGSANKNNRGMLTEAEINVAVVDQTIVRAAMSRIMDNLAPDLNLSGQSFDVWWTKLAEVAAWNDWVRAQWKGEGDDISLDGAALPQSFTPMGFVYSLSFGEPDDCLLESVGPDMT